MILKIIFWLGYVALNIFIADINNDTRLNNIVKKIETQINHPLWGTVYCALCLAIFPIGNWHYIHTWCAFLSVLFLHASVFPVAYNVYSKLPWFHLSSTSTALYDKLLLKMGLTSSEIPAILSFFISIIFLFLWIHK